ncbi:hypothetical protein Poli38472_009244 [Pythium oligandrum]|uniref:Uncharacterized protein n=1 Tax=Pythium oligandrum TaxID=41045 RepID=A0A8K1CKD7_PYTOL|nr:hypothetical protein Poli38472_009244 [Pythium oligandrum]|eukprot:TMW65077.1 hypothetical protein Poli38472_009244 [Pythium oligandrum]
MFRSDWDLVAPLSWLGDLADEEAFFAGRDLGVGSDSTTTTTLIFLPETSAKRRRRGGRRGQQQPPQIQQTESGKKQEKPTAVPEAKETRESDELKRAQLLNEDFFEDLPLGARQFETKVPANISPPDEKTKDGYAYYTYSYSCCATLDDEGRPVESTRRRFENSAGCLKAAHRRVMGGRSMESTWVKTSEQDQGKHDKRVSSGDTETFEKGWAHTPFGVAEQQAVQKGEKKQTELPDAPPPQEIP